MGLIKRAATLCPMRYLFSLDLLYCRIFHEFRAFVGPFKVAPTGTTELGCLRIGLTVRYCCLQFNFSSLTAILSIYIYLYFLSVPHATICCSHQPCPGSALQ